MSAPGTEKVHATADVIFTQTVPGSSGRMAYNAWSGQNRNIFVLWQHRNSGNFVNPTGGNRSPRMSDIRILDNSDEPNFSCAAVLQHFTQRKLKDPGHFLKLEKHSPHVSLVG